MSNVGKRVLLVDDDVQLVGLLDIRLSKIGYQVTPVTKAEQGYYLALDGDYDAIVLDVLMPGMNGLELCARLREHGVLTPILVLSGQAETDIVVRGLNAGADDYLTKPFNDYELVARLKALLRRTRKAFQTQMLERFDVVLDVPGRMVRLEDNTIGLTRKETLLLKRLMAESPRPVSRLSLLQDVWGIGDAHASNRLDVYIRRLRQKLLTLGGGDYVQTIRSGGYYFGKTNSSSRAVTAGTTAI